LEDIEHEHACLLGDVAVEESKDLSEAGEALQFDALNIVLG